MSYAKLTTPDPDVVKFYYLYETLFNIIKERTAVRAQRQKNDKGEAMLDEYAITEGDESVYTRLVTDAFNEVGRTVLRWMKGISDSIFINETTLTEDPSTNTDNACGFSVVDNAAYNENTLEMMDNKIKQCVTYHMTYNWYLLCGWDTEAKKYVDLYLNARKDLVNMIIDIAKPNLT